MEPKRLLKKGDVVVNVSNDGAFEPGERFIVATDQDVAGVSGLVTLYNITGEWLAHRFKLASMPCGCTTELDCDKHSIPPAITTAAVEKILSPPVCRDFAGTIDGGGVKTVMKAPKCPLEFMPPQFTESIADVLLKGATKYSKHNWMRGMSWETVLGAILRHLSAFRRGEEMDSETGLPHLAHAACGLMFMHWYAHGPTTDQYRKLDDRMFTGKVDGNGK